MEAESTDLQNAGTQAEATEEALWNSLFAASTVTSNGITIEALPVEEVVEMFKNR